MHERSEQLILPGTESDTILDDNSEAIRSWEPLGFIKGGTLVDMVGYAAAKPTLDRLDELDRQKRQALGLYD